MLGTVTVTDNFILNNRGNKQALNAALDEVNSAIKRLDVKMDIFLEKYCPGLTSLERLDLDTKDPMYRFYNFQREQYASLTRIVRLIKAYS
jgi:hypothetical protein